jgi:hemolysin activation/secretion protein
LDIPDVDAITDNSAKKIVPLKPAPRRSRPQQQKSAETFVLKEIRIDGSQIYKTKDLLPVFRFYIGKRVTLETLNKILVRIDAYYQSNGWLAVRSVLPQQSISNGIVRIRVFEGFIADVVVEGDAGISKQLIEGSLKPLKTGKPTRYSDVDAAIRQLQVFSHLQLTPSLRPSPTKAGGVDLVIKVQSIKPYSGLFNISNTSSDTFGSWTSALTTSFYFAETSIRVYLSNSFLEPEAFLVGRLDYERQLDYFGSKLGAYVSGNRFRIDSSGLDSKSFDAGLFYYLSSYRSSAFNLETQFSYDWSRDLTLQGGAVNTQGDTHTLTLGLSGDYHTAWLSFVSFTLNLKQGLTDGGGLDQGNDSGGIDFTRRARWLTMDLSYTQPLRAQENYIPSFSFALTGRGQYSFSPLINNERITFGKNAIGRGFDNGRISGDHGWGLSGELRASWTHIGISNQRSVIQDLTLYSFADVAQTFYHNRSRRGVDLEEKRELLSAGAGVRIRWADKFYTEFNWARVLNNPFRKPISLQFGFFPQGQDTSDKGSDDYTIRLYHIF